MQFHTRRYADTLVAAPLGRIDHESAKQFEAALAPLLAQLAARDGALVLDFSGIKYISSVGLRVLMIAARQLRERKAPFVVAELQSLVAEVFAISRFDRVLIVKNRLEDALAMCSAEALSQYRAAGAAPVP